MVALILVVFEVDLVVASIAEGFVLRCLASATAAVLLRDTRSPCLAANNLYGSHKMIRPILYHGHRWSSFRVLLFDAIDAVTERSGWALLDHGDDIPGVGRVRVNPRLHLASKNRGQPALAEPSVRTEISVVMDGYPLAFIVAALLGAPVRFFLPAKADPFMRTITKRLACGTSAATEAWWFATRDFNTVGIINDVAFRINFVLIYERPVL